MRAELYALTHRGNPGDLAFYQRLCRNARSVLELGSGYGRVLGALAAANRRLLGLELDSALIRLARRNLATLSAPKRRTLRLVQADMRAFDVGQKFECVLLPYNTLYCLLSVPAALGCFRAARRALQAGGLLSFDVWNAEGFHNREVDRSRRGPAEAMVSVRHAGRTWDVFEQLQVRRSAQRLLARYHYVPRAAERVITIPIAQRYFLAGELDSLLTRSGFELAARCGDFVGSRYTARSAHQVVIARAI